MEAKALWNCSSTSTRNCSKPANAVIASSSSAVGGTLFFIAYDGIRGYEVWKSDGTASGTVLVKDIRPGTGGSVPRWLTNVGLCGGMAFAVRDYFEAGRPPPDDTTAPGKGPLFDYLVDRLFDSFNLPLGPIRYLELMNPLLPERETVWSRLGLAERPRSSPSTTLPSTSANRRG